MQRPRDDFQTDALRPAALPSASLKTRTAEEHTIEQTSDAYLDSIYEDWNKKVDIEVETLVEGMVELVNIASIGNKDKYKVAQEAFEAQCRTESMVRSRVDERTYTNYFPQVRAATSLLSITHSLKLLLLLSDEEQIASKRDDAAAEFKQTTERERASAAKALDSLLNK